MKDLLEISCGLDVHKEKIVACILTGSLGKPTHSEIREFTTLIPDMIALRDWIVSQNCHLVAMSATSLVVALLSLGISSSYKERNKYHYIFFNNLITILLTITYVNIT